MGKERGWFLLLIIVALFLAACGPQMATPTPGEKADSGATPATVKPTGETPRPETASSGELAVDADDWHVLGSSEAPVTIVEYSDFQ